LRNDFVGNDFVKQFVIFSVFRRVAPQPWATADGKKYLRSLAFIFTPLVRGAVKGRG